MPDSGYPGQRISFDTHLCTVRYVGPIRNTKKGDWLGVEWDDPSRGKHDGSHEDVRYFGCRYDHGSRPILSFTALLPSRVFFPVLNSLIDYKVAVLLLLTSSNEVVFSHTAILFVPIKILSQPTRSVHAPVLIYR